MSLYADFLDCWNLRRLSWSISGDFGAIWNCDV